jgi:hypothetical protein
MNQISKIMIKGVAKALFVILPALFSFSASIAQWELGGEGGISLPNLTATGSNNNPLNTGYKSRLGPAFGIYDAYSISTHFSLKMAVEYSGEGGKKDGMQALTTPTEVREYFESQNQTPPQYLYANYNSVAKLDYLMIPLMARFGWNFHSGSPWRFYAEGGPFVSFLLSAKQVTSGTSQLYLDPAGMEAFPGGPQSFDSTTDIKSQTHAVDFGFEANIGLSLRLAEKSHSYIFLQLGGNYGLINIQKGTANGKNNTGAATAMIGYCYHFGDKTQAK